MVTPAAGCQARRSRPGGQERDAGSRKPRVILTARSAAGAPGCNPRRTHAATATPIASTVSASSDGWHWIGPRSGSSECAMTVASTRICSALRCRCRNRPRTVEGGMWSSAPIRAAPNPRAARRSVVNAFRELSRRRGRHDAGSSTWVTRHDWQRDRRGVTAMVVRWSRTWRRRAQPHGASEPAQREHDSRPASRSCSAVVGLRTRISVSHPFQCALPRGRAEEATRVARIGCRASCCQTRRPCNDFAAERDLEPATPAMRPDRPHTP